MSSMSQLLGKALVVFSSFLLVLTSSSCEAARNFTDDRGEEFSWPDDGSAKPTVVVNANGAIALFHLGMTNEQILGVWDKWIIRGSDIDLNSQDLNSMFDSDPGRDEVDFLKSVKDLSPECSQSSEGCKRQFDATLLEELAPDFVVYMHHGPYLEITNQVVQSTGKNPIYIDTRFEDNQGCRTETYDIVATNCYARSVFDVITRTQELAAFLTGGGGPESEDLVKDDQQRMCEAANEFTLVAEQLHDRGVLCAGATARLTNGGNINLININQNPWLRTFEELGLPLMHPELPSPTDFTRTYTTEQWFPGCNRFGGDDFNCDGIAPAYPVDCWLFDSRSYPVVVEEKEGILEVLSVEAIREDQFSYLLLNDGAISYKTVAAVLKQVTADLKNLQSIYDEKLGCTRVEVTSRDQISLAYGGLEGGEYACFDRDMLNSDMLTCPEGFTPGTSSSPELEEKDDVDNDIQNSSPSSQSKNSRSVVVALNLVLLGGVALGI